MTSENPTDGTPTREIHTETATVEIEQPKAAADAQPAPAATEQAVEQTPEQSQVEDEDARAAIRPTIPVSILQRILSAPFESPEPLHILIEFAKSSSPSPRVALAVLNTADEGIANIRSGGRTKPRA